MKTLRSTLSAWGGSLRRMVGELRRGQERRRLLKEVREIRAMPPQWVRPNRLCYMIRRQLEKPKRPSAESIHHESKP